MLTANEISCDVRRAVAFVAWCLITGREGAGIYDHANDTEVAYSGVVTDTKIDLNGESGSRISGAGGSGLFTLTTGVRAKPVTLKISGLEFEGFDYGASSRYSGSVDKSELSIREGRDDRSYSFSVSEK